MTTADNIILAPLSFKEFITHTWEKTHHHVARNNPEYFASLIATSDIERLLSTRDVFFPDVQVVHHETNISRFDYTDESSQIDPIKLAQLVAQGATMVVSNAQKQFSELAALCRDVTQSLQMRCQTNLYLSPPGNQGFGSHYDTHDVFILQVQGIKTFRFYPSDVELPFPDDQYDPEQNPHTDVTETVTLNAGDTLYIPRGLVHDALAHPEEPSLHITLGVFPAVVRDVLQEAIQVAAEQRVVYRHSVLDERVRSAGATSAFKALMAAVLTEEVLQEAWSRISDRAALDATPVCEPTLTHHAITLTATSMLTRTQEMMINIERRDEQLKLRLMGQIICFDEPLSRAVEWVCQQSSFRVDEVPGLDSAQKIALCTHLLHANAVRAAQAP